MKSLVSVSIGPVQEFITAARRTRDLWYGSHLLSELSKAAAACAVSYGADLIFPYPENERELQRGSNLQVVNKLLLTCTMSPADLVVGIRKAVAIELEGHVNEAITNAQRDGKIKQIDEPRVREQLKSLVEFSAAWTPLVESNKYDSARLRVESLLAARKSLRDFPYYEGTSAKKSTIDGVREDIIIDRGGAAKRLLKASERLDGVGLIKRFGGSQPSFESTSDVAAVPFARYSLRCAIGNSAIQNAIDDYRSYVEDELGYLLGVSHRNPYNQTVGFGNASLALLTDHESRQDELSDEQRNKLSSLQRSLFRALSDANPSPYYGLLMADGDAMGKTLDQLGESAEPGKTALQRHQDFSRTLSGFASQCRAIVQQRGVEDSGWGNLIYAGGDDVLALVPVDTALQTAHKLQETFAHSMRDALPVGAPKPTLSVSMVIAHALDDLTGVRRVADQVLHDVAKDKYGRNAVVITSMRRSGESFSVGGKWGDFDTRVQELVRCYATGQVPFGLGYDWRRLAELCQRNQVENGVVKKLALSLLKQKSERAQSVLTNLTATVSGTGDLRQLADELVIAHQIFQCSYFETDEINAVRDVPA